MGELARVKLCLMELVATPWKLRRILPKVHLLIINPLYCQPMPICLLSLFLEVKVVYSIIAQIEHIIE